MGQECASSVHVKGCDLDPILDLLVKYGMTKQQAQVGLSILGALGGILMLRKLLKKKYRLPPGPRSYPLVGSLLSKWIILYGHV